MPDAVDVGSFSNGKALVIDARLHPADVVAHDEENIRLLLCGCCALAGPAAHTDTNAVAPRSTARDAEPKLSRLDFSHDVSCGGAHGILEASLLIASSFVGCFKRENSPPVVLHADDDPPVLLRLVVQLLGEPWPTLVSGRLLSRRVWRTDANFLPDGWSQ